MKTRLILTVAAAACGGMFLFGQAGSSGPYTQDQAAAGRAVYQTNCASCHSADLAGREGPQLAGANFLAQWGQKTAGELITYMRSAMPPGGVVLPGDSYLNVAAFILDANSARAGNQALTTASNVTIRSVASGQRAAYLQTGGGPAAVQAKQDTKQNNKQGKQANQEKQAPRGITVSGEVKNYVPVTDAMLLRPDPA